MRTSRGTAVPPWFSKPVRFSECRPLIALFEALSPQSRTAFLKVGTATSMADWTLTGPNAVVKVVSTEDGRRTARSGAATGYVTQAKFIDGLNANQIERDLGLRPNSMNSGLYVFWFARLPTASEAEYRFSADWPDGHPWSDSERTRFFLERETVLSVRARLPITQGYPPGSGKIPQWKLINPVPLSGFYRQATPSTPLYLQ